MGSLAFDVFWRDHGASRGLQGLGKDASTSQKHVETLGDHGKRLAGAFAGFAAIEVFKGFIDDARESAKISRVTENVIRSTGGAAHVTSGQVGDLATAISNKTGADDEAIQSGANMLLTFTGIRNEVGKGNNIFDQATQTTVDLAAAMNNGEVTTDGMKTASIQLGKALNDPIQGVGALRRVGVSFTAQQKEQIKTLVESGRTMDAQKIILGELNKEFGGTAKAAADPMQRLSVIMGNLGEQVGGALLPAMNDFADFMANTGAPALSTFVGVLGDVPAPAYAVMAALVGITGAVKAGHVVLESYHQVTEATGAALKILGLRSAGAAGDVEASVGRMGKLKGALGGITGLLGGPWGLALTAAAVGVGIFVKGQLDAKQRVDDLTASLDKNTGALTQQTVSMVSQKLQQEGILGIAEKFGVSLGDVTDAALGNADAIGRVRGQLTPFLAEQSRVRPVVGYSTQAMSDQGSQAQRLMDAVGGSNAEIRAAVTAYHEQQTASQQVSAALQGSTAATNTAAGAQRGAAGATREHGSTLKELLDTYPKYKATVLAAAGATSADKAETVQLTAAQVRQVKAAVTLQAATDALTTALDANKNATLQLRGGEAAWYSALDATRKALKDNSRTLDVHTEKGRANRQALDSLASSGLSYLGVIQQNEGVGRHFKRTLDVQWQALYDAARRFGSTRIEARKYADQIYATPKTLTLRVLTPGLGAARAGARGLAYDIAHINGRIVTVRYRSDGSVQIGAHVARAAGGRIPGWSPSKTADNVPVMATAGEHMWSVDEVARAGGHGAVERLRGMARSGRLQGLASGGAVNRNLTTRYQGSFPQHPITNAMDAWAAAMATGGGGSGGGRGGPIPGGSGVARWGPMVHRMLSVVGLSQSLWGNWMRQIATESGGNPNAVQGNIGDVNNRSGDLAKGLLQVIGATFRAYHWPGTSWSPFDPWANMTAAGNYGKHRYGSSLGAVIGHGHGYARGTRHASPGWHWVGEDGPEFVRFRGGEQVMPASQAVRIPAGGGASKVTVNVTMNLDPSAHAFEDKVVGAINRAVRTARLSRVVLPGVRQ